MADNLPPSSADVTESGSLNLPKPSGSHRPVMGLLYLFTVYSILRIYEKGIVISESDNLYLHYCVTTLPFQRCRVLGEGSFETKNVPCIGGGEE
jgi:hypothetical protein